MKTLSYQTKSAKPAEVQRQWFVVDAEDKALGRMAARIAHILRGKHKPSYTPHIDTGDYVIVLNAGKYKLTGNKAATKEYITFSGYPGGQRRTVAEDMVVKRPTYPVENAVRGMLPKNRLGRQMFKKLFVYEGDSHPHTAQQPTEINL